MAHVEEPDDRKIHGDSDSGGHSDHSDHVGQRGAGEAARPHRLPRSIGRRVVCTGSLLVSATDLREPTFRRTVIYMIEHTDAGSLGVVLNRSTDVPVRSVLPYWASLAAQPTVLYLGGPVKRDAAMCLAVLRRGVRVERVAGLRRIAGRVALLDLDADPVRVAPYVEGVRIFAGYAGWTGGQLVGELDRSDWMVLSARAGDLLESANVDLWARVLRRQPLPLALRATHPIELERN